MCVLILVLLTVTAVSCDSHSFRLYYIVSAPGSGLPAFSIVGYVDDQQIWLYSNEIRRTIPLAPWMKKNIVSEYLENEATVAKGDEAFFRHELKIVITRLNHTEGFHFLQVIVGCELGDDGSTAGYALHKYDGREFMFFDLQTATYIPTMAGAQVTTQRWNSPEINMRERAKHYLENICMERLKSFIEYGREDLERRVRPGVKVMGRKSGEFTKLHCQVYGFHPRAVDVKWMKNRIDEVPYEESTYVLPNPDGTYQIRVAVEVIPQEGDNYFCYVDHSSLEEPLLVKWEPKQDFPPSVVISVVVISVLVLTSVIAGVIIYKKKKSSTAAGNEEMREAYEFPVT